MNSSKLELYIHIPFCHRKCAYCDFLSMSGQEAYWLPYRDALCRDIVYAGSKDNRELTSIFIGGGTPSLMPAGYYEELFRVLRESFRIAEDCEITIEMNPGTVSCEKLAEYRRVGINRLSIGLQSVHEEELRELGRIHTYAEFAETYRLAREVGFDNINVDLMMAFPGQTAESYGETLRKIISLRPEHISAYGLIVEPGTPYEKRYEAHPEHFPGEEQQCALYEFTVSMLTEAGYEQYEISNFSLPGRACRHNLGYWNRTEYLGIGLGAASLYDGVRRSVTRDMPAYLEQLCYASEEVLAEDDVVEEVIMLSLRTTQGLDIREHRSVFGAELADRLRRGCETYVRQGLMAELEGRFFFTTAGFLVSNQVIAALLP